MASIVPNNANFFTNTLPSSWGDFDNCVASILPASEGGVNIAYPPNEESSSPFSKKKAGVPNP
jgi:hypothetical protein